MILNIFLTMALASRIELLSSTALVEIIVDCGCHQVGNNLTCKDCVPAFVPYDTYSVSVINNSVPLKAEMFQSYSWRNVRMLDIREDELLTKYIHTDTFANLISLTFLGLHIKENFDHLYQVGNGTLAGLGYLKHLDLSGCERFSFDLLYYLLSVESNFPNLNKLTMNDFNTAGNYGTKFDLNSSFEQILATRKIKSLQVDRTILTTIYVNPVGPMCSVLEEISLRKSIIMDINATKQVAVCESLTKVDFSGFKSLKFPNSQFSSININLTDNSRFLPTIYFVANVKTAILDNLLPTAILPPKIPINIIFERNLTLALENVSLQKNNLQFLNLEIHSHTWKKIKVADLSNNRIQYLSWKMFGNSTAINTLYLGNNSLFKMAVDHTKDFEKMFWYLKNLKQIDLSGNSLVYIPDSYFHRNRHISTVILSNNKLTGFFQRGTAKPVKIDLSDNKITHLDLRSREWFDTLFKSNKSFTLNLSKNPIQCNCKVLQFVQWLLNASYVITDSPLTCENNGQLINLTFATLKQIEKQCLTSNTLLYIFYGVCSPVILFASAVILRRILRRLKLRHLRRKRRIRAVRALKSEMFQYTYVSFIMMNVQDEDIVNDTVYPSLINGLNAVTGCHRKLVGVTDLDFRIGHSIFSELNRCLNESAVIIVIVTRNLCESSYCKNELEQAILQTKPFLLLFSEVVKEENMPPVLRHLYQKWPHANVNFTAEDVTFSPCIEIICMMILELVVLE